MHHYLWNGYAEVRRTDYYERSVCGFPPSLFGFQKSTLSHRYGSFAFYPFESFASVEKPRGRKKNWGKMTLAIENGDK